MLFVVDKISHETRRPLPAHELVTSLINLEEKSLSIIWSFQDWLRCSGRVGMVDYKLGMQTLRVFRMEMSPVHKSTQAYFYGVY